MYNLLCGVPLSIWYDWKNDGTDPQEREHNFGTVMPDLTPKPSYVAIQTLTRELTGYRIARRLSLASDQDYVLSCTNAAGDIKLAAWTLGEPHTITLDKEMAGSREVRVVDSQGKLQTAKNQEGKLGLDLVAGPKYVTIKGR